MFYHEWAYVDFRVSVHTIVCLLKEYEYTLSLSTHAYFFFEKSHTYIF
jgi:hypothetical protein